MDSNNDRFKKLLSEETGPLPPELNWDQMEAGILKKMEELRAEVAPQRKNGLNRGLLAGILLLLLIGTCTFVERQSGTSLFSSKKEKNAAEQGFLPMPATPQPANKKQVQPEVCPEEKEPQKTTTNSSILQKSPAQPITSTTSFTNNWKRPTFIPQPPTPASPQEPLKTESLPEPQAWGQVPAIQTLPGKPITWQTNLTLGNSSDQAGPLAAPTAPPTKPAADRKQLAFLGGLSFWDMGYGQTPPERATFEQSLLSYQAQLNYTHPLKKGFLLMAGLQVQQLNSHFEWSTDLENYTIILQDTIIQVQANSLTGQQNIVRGDVELTVNATRNVRHFNQMRLYQIPLAIGKSWRVQRWQMDLLVGGTMTIFSENKGRSLYQGQLIDYNGASTPLLNNQWQVQALAAGRMSYFFSDHLGIQAGLQFQKSLTNWSLESGVTMRPWLVGGELGLVYVWR